MRAALGRAQGFAIAARGYPIWSTPACCIRFAKMLRNKKVPPN
jgi:hypothetical protein